MHRTPTIATAIFECTAYAETPIHNSQTYEIAFFCHYASDAHTYPTVLQVTCSSNSPLARHGDQVILSSTADALILSSTADALHYNPQNVSQGSHDTFTKRTPANEEGSSCCGRSTSGCDMPGQGHRSRSRPWSCQQQSFLLLRSTHTDILWERLLLGPTEGLHRCRESYGPVTARPECNCGLCWRAPEG